MDDDITGRGKLGVRTAELKRFSRDNVAFTPDTATMGAGYRRPVSSATPLAEVHIATARSSLGLYSGGPLQRATGVVEAPAQVLRIKPFQKEVKKLSYRMRSEFVSSLLRNVLCAVFVTGLVTTYLEEHHIPDWFIKEKIPSLILLLCGLVGVVIQVAHVTNMLRGGSPTIISHMLRHAKSRDDFMGVMAERRNAAPFMAVEVMLRRHRDKKKFTNHHHWVHLTKESLKSLVYNTWDDQSTQIDNAMKNKTCWLILAKDYITDSVNTRKSFEADIDAFREVSGFDMYLARLKLKYVLDVQRGESFPDVEPHFVFDEMPPVLQSIQAYIVTSFLAIDFLYLVLFYLTTKNAGVCRLVKCMSRTRSPNKPTIVNIESEPQVGELDV